MNQMNQEKLLLPSERNLRMLTEAQRREIKHLQEKRVVTTLDSFRLRVLRGLGRKGVVRFAPGDTGRCSFTLSDPWLAASIDPKPPKWMRLPPPKIQQPEPPMPPVTKEKEKDPTPDPPKKKFVRPAAVYSNRSADQLIDHILRTY